MASERLVKPWHKEDVIIELAELIGEENQATYGTDLNKIIKEHRLRLKFSAFQETFDGLISFRDGVFTIACNTTTGNYPSGIRTRFTIAHELGHYFIDGHRHALVNNLMPSLGENAKQDLPMEREADLFASRLLLPSSVFNKAFRKAERGLEGVIALSKQFSVSIKCAALRYLSEDYVSCCISFWSWDRKIVWKLFSKSLYLAGIRKMKWEPIHFGATDKVLNTGPQGEFEVKQTQATTKYLFLPSENAYLNEFFTEEAVSLGKHGVLSLYSADKGKLEPIAKILERRWFR